jgi:membrane protein DedA with SNARE-associated domain
MSIPEFAVHELARHASVAYPLIFSFQVFEGDVILFASAFLAHRGVLNSSMVLGAAYAGVCCADFGWYLVGRRYCGALDRVARRLGPMLERVDQHLQTRVVRTLLVSKFTFGGVCRATMVRAGMLGVPLVQFVRASLLSNIIWASAFFVSGYLTSAGLSLFGEVFRLMEVALVFGLVGFGVLEWVVARRAQAQL